MPKRGRFLQVIGWCDPHFPVCGTLIAQNFSGFKKGTKSGLHWKATLTVHTKKGGLGFYIRLKTTFKTFPTVTVISGKRVARIATQMQLPVTIAHMALLLRLSSSEDILPPWGL
jgi:hypothetical protein